MSNPKIKFKDKEGNIVEPSTIALNILSKTNQNHTAQEETFFVAGFESGTQFMHELHKEKVFVDYIEGHTT